MALEFTDLVSDNEISQLSIYKSRIEDRASKLREAIDQVSVFDDMLFEMEESNIDFTTVETSLVTNLLEWVDEGISVTLDDVVYAMYVENTGDLVISRLNGEGRPKSETYRVVLEANHHQGQIINYILHKVTIPHSDGLTINLQTFFNKAFIRPFDESSFVADVISAISAGAITNATDFTSYFQNVSEKLCGETLQMFNSLKSCLLGTSPVSAVTNWLNNKLKLGAFVESIGDKFSFDLPTFSQRWLITGINWSVIGRGLMSIAQVVGEILLIAGGPIVKAIGVGVNVTSGIISKVLEMTNEGTQPDYEPENALLSWAGTDLHISEDRSKNDYGVLDYNWIADHTMPDYGAQIVDVGTCKYLLQNLGFNETLNRNIYDLHVYPKANFIAYDDELADFIHEFYEPAPEVGTYGLWAVCIKDVPMVSITNKIHKFIKDHQQSQFYIDSLFNGEPEAETLLLNSYWIGVFMLLVTHSSHLGNSGSKRVIYEGDSIRYGFGHYPDAGFSCALTERWVSYWADKTNNGTEPLENADWESMIHLANELLDELQNKYRGTNRIYFFSDSQHSLSYTGIVSKAFLVDNEGFVITDSQGTISPHCTGWSDDKATYGNYNIGATCDNTPTDSQEVLGTAVLCRYKPPKIGISLIRFVTIFSICVAVAVAAVAAFKLTKRITRNKRQNTLMKNYNDAVEKAKENPTKENVKAMRKAKRKLKKDIKRYGQSPYLCDYAGSTFGWDDGTSEVVETSDDEEGDLSSRIQYIMASINGETDVR